MQHKAFISDSHIAPGSARPAILLIEDSHTDTLLIQSMLAHADDVPHTIVHAANLEEGLQQLEHEDFAVILLDLSLPDSHGLQTFQALQQHAHDIPIIVLTGSRDRKLALYAIQQGAQDYLVKDDANPSALGKAIQYAIERKQAEQRIRFQASLLDQVQSAVFATDSNDRIIYWNCFAAQLYQWPKELAIGRDFSELIVADSSKALLVEIQHALTNKQTWEGELEFRRRDASVLPTQLTLSIVRDHGDRVSGYVGIASDIAARKEAERKLEHTAFHDALTELPNRLLFTERLERAIARSIREGGRYAVMILDLDGFKMINDNLGHLVGDELLVQFSRRVESCLRPQDTLARLGGDEFTILLDDLQHTTDAIRVAERIHEQMAQPFHLDQTEIHTSASIGITFGTANYKESSHAVRDADIAMYRAKNQGKGRHVIFNSGMHDHIDMQLKHENRLRRAIDFNEFDLQFQPIVELATRRCVATAAQIHWHSPALNRLSSQELATLTDETGLTIPLSQTLLNEACRALRVWQDASPATAEFTIHVKLTGRQLCHRNLIEHVNGVLQRNRLQGRQLTLEIPEDVLHQQPVIAAATLGDLRDLGVAVCLDDFGTGYSSLSHLHRYPLSAIKVGRSFVSNLEHSSASRVVIEAILRLCENLGLHLIADNVETEQQLAQLTELGCQRAQGNILQRPLNLQEMQRQLLQDISRAQ